MTVQNILNDGIDYIFKNGGLTTTINIIEYTFDSGSYDDDTTQTITGSQTISGLIFPIKSSQGSEEALLLEQGKLLTQDKIMYVGSLNTSGNLLIEIQGDNYTIIPDGIQQWTVSNNTIYNKIFLRQSLGGSLF